VRKYSLRVAAYGTLDEANSVIGIARLHTADMADVDAMLARIQNDLFDAGADLCTPNDPNEDPKMVLRIVQEQIDRLEREIDAMNAPLGALQSFILPGGSAAGAYLHLARTVVRRGEREITELAEHEPINRLALIYANRLSDHLFVLSRHVNAAGAGDVLWVPGSSR
jgi:cob(I)alamin adenosyltransferase